jgi:hypothetical protein
VGMGGRGENKQENISDTKTQNIKMLCFFFSPGAPRVFGIGIAVGSDIFDFGSHYVGEAVDAAVELMHRAGSAAGEQLFVALVFTLGLFFFVCFLFLIFY